MQIKMAWLCFHIIDNGFLKLIRAKTIVSLLRSRTLRIPPPPNPHSRQTKRFISLTLGSGLHALHGDLCMTASQSSGIEAIRVDIRQDATHPKKVPMRRMGTRAKHVIA